MRRKIIAGNWKMNFLTSDTEKLIRYLLDHWNLSPCTDSLICPPFTSLSAAAEMLKGNALELGAQDVFWKEKGAYTGQVSPSMLIDIGCKYVIVGHSERRGRFGVPEPDFDTSDLSYFGDNNRTVNRKLIAALAAGLTPICCVGETLEERQSGRTDEVVTSQTAAALKNVSVEDAGSLVFAYEPVWAIGTGEVCPAEEANRVCGLIRRAVANVKGESASESVRIQYGGSVKPDNAADILFREEIDGALVGGASLKAADFLDILSAAG